MGWLLAWPVRSISVRAGPHSAGTRCIVAKRPGRPLEVDPCEAEKAFALPLISVEDYVRRVLG